ncbi:fibronectin type III domain-containing protein [Actinomadura sp. PM05-2]|uniref:Fibronectin type III domain-containing protein n=1 Tax=Actinomadura parmotrematis TaxID=2864039 RepID=A0ABS7FP28_9ACTN|nr:fibronectin type III domain-containing protein [Actinomadura parmotrematis]
MALAGTAAAGLVTGFVGVAGVGPASADPVSLSLKYTCVFPLIGEQTVTAAIKSDIPKSVPVNTPIPKIVIDVTSTQNEDTWSGLNLVGASTLEGTATANSTVIAPQGNVAVKVPVVLDKTTLPVSDTPVPFDMHGSGQAPAIRFSKAGHAKITVGDLKLNITPRDSTGAEVEIPDPSADIHNVACTLLPGQNTSLAEFDITDGGTTPTPTPTDTPTPTPTPTPTDTPTPTPTPTDTGGGGTVKYGYTLKGSTFVKAPNGTAPLNGSIDANLKLSTGEFTADLALDPTKGDFQILGFLPVQAGIQLVPQGKTTGKLDPSTKILTTHSQVITKLPSFTLFGIPLGGGDQCQTATPSDITLTSTGVFAPTKGGDIKGTYDLSEIKDCNILTPILSAFTAGKGNTITATLTPKK